MRTERTQIQGAPEVTGEAALSLFAEALGKAGCAKLRARGSSMRPFIHDGDLLLIRKCGADELAFGDIAACKRGGGLVIHRLARKARAGLVLKGDALGRTDAPISPGKLLGRVETIESPRGNFYLNTSAGRAANVAALVYMLPVSALLAAWGRIREGRAPARENGAAKRLRGAAERPVAVALAASKLCNRSRGAVL